MPRIDYARIRILREHILKEYFQFYSATILDSPEFQTFQEENPWLLDYGLFKSIKNHCHWHSWLSWPEEIKQRNPETLLQLYKKFEIDISYFSFIQYLCFQQMAQVKKQADELGIFLKGDIPILLDRESVDIWAHSNQFDLEFVAGAPPDAYSKEGQNWGFPLYKWHEMEAQNFSWWRERLKTASKFYHLYRIDHVVGFFRIWSIPKGKKGNEGHFDPSDPQEALAQGRRLLGMMLETTNMLPIGEDLGTIPPEVRIALKSLGICGTKVMRWERNWDNHKEFIAPDKYSPLSVTTVSTHDSSTLQAWWKDDSQEAKEYCLSQGWKYSTPLPIEYHFAILYTSHHTGSLFHINLLQEYLALFPEFVHSTPEDERINVPGISDEKNWTYRFRPSIEKIVSSEELALVIRKLID